MDPLKRLQPGPWVSQPTSNHRAPHPLHQDGSRRRRALTAHPLPAAAAAPVAAASPTMRRRSGHQIRWPIHYRIWAEEGFSNSETEERGGSEGAARHNWAGTSTCPFRSCLGETIPGRIRAHPLPKVGANFTRAYGGPRTLQIRDRRRRR